jgi:uncharacterized protein YdhG (YjbR/CyaY superfamily)
MEADRPAPATIDEYIAGFPADVQAVLRQVRATIRDAAPDAEESISYGIPTFRLNGTHLVYFAGYRKHVSVYPAPVGNADFAEEMSVYGSGKGTAKFPLEGPIPWDLIRRIVEFRMEETRRKRGSRGG